MPDNSPQGGSDVIRTLARVAGTVKTQVYQLDLGGVTGNAEVLLTAGQQAMAVSIPVVIASNQTSIPVTLGAGTALAGKVGIDQTTPGTTNKVALSDSLGSSMNSAGSGFLKVTDEPRQVFYDSFDAALDTTNYWTSTQGSSGVAALVTAGVMAMGTGTVANGYSKLVSIPTFKPLIPAWLVFSDAIALPDGAAPTANAYRYWGSGTTPAAPTVAAPVTDGYGFELNTDGKMRAVVYAGGVRTIIQDMSATGNSKQPLDAAYHRYIIQVRTDRTFFYVDSIDAAGLAASTSFQSPQAQILPKLFLCVGNATAPLANTQIQCTGAVVSDGGKNATLIADATFPWRRASVSAAGAIAFNATQLSGVAVSAGNGVAGAGVQRVTIASDNTAFPVNAIPPTLTKGTQGATGYSVQDLRDAGRNTRVFMLDAYAAAPLIEAMQSVVQWYGNAAVAASVSPAVVPAGKVLRLTSWAIFYKSLATVGSSVVRVRINTGGTAVLASPLAYTFETGSISGSTTVAMTGGSSCLMGDFPEGFDIPAAAGVGFSMAGYGPTGVLTLGGPTRFAVSGYEF